MGHRFAELVFTETVQAEQLHAGSLRSYRQMLGGEDFNHRLSSAEAGFIQTRDSFYMASVSESGWPYVQHRGGAPGFVRVLDETTLGFADYSGNRQYVSLGNFKHDDRVALFFMDYPNRARLKLLGRIRLVAGDDLATLAMLEQEEFRAPVERGYLIDIEGFDWNCPKYITPRFSAAEWQRTAPVETPAEQAPAEQSEVLGDGSLQLQISGVQQLTPQIRSYHLRAADGGLLPEFTPGAHLQLPIPAAQGIRMGQYSLCGDTQRRDEYQIAVRAGENSQLAAALQQHYQLGTRLAAEPPQNYFALHEDNCPALLIAGGIGITPLRSMALTLLQRGVEFELHYAAKSLQQMAYYSELKALLGERFKAYFSLAGQRLVAVELLAGAAPHSQIYVCGPDSLLKSVQQAGRDLQLPADRLHMEAFS